MGTGSIAVRLVTWTKAFTGNLPGGIALTTVGVNTVFGAISGSAPAATATLGKILYPELRKEGYSVPFSAGLLAGMGALDSVIPPSINIILFAATANVCMAPAVSCRLRAEHHHRGSNRRLLLSLRADHKSATRAVSSGPAAAALLPSARGAYRPYPPRDQGGYLGTRCSGHHICRHLQRRCDADRGGGSGCVYSLFVSVFVYRDLAAAGLFESLKQSAFVTAQIFLIMSAAGLFVWVLVIAQVPQALVQFIEGLGWSAWTVILMIQPASARGWHVHGPCFSDCDPNTAPEAAGALDGLDPIHFGTIMVVNLAIGLFTPPFGLNLFVVMSVCNVSMGQVVKGLTPLLVLYLIGLMLVSFIPMLSLWLPIAFYR